MTTSDPSDPEGNPLPVLDLASARVEIETLGMWQVIAPLLPPPLVNPETAGMAIARSISNALGGAAPTPEVQDLAADAAEAWSGFLADPRVLSVRSGNTTGLAGFRRLRNGSCHPSLGSEPASVRVYRP
ncbi:hypothetical protein [Palleronia abyssalis]|uniref:hypothetical protein n=1 Tax=Palleronia abyssalis TaxID=1501240 RepID=UPI0011B28552|nr:hypothetical protein [Palleronia abyssalis]